MNPHAFKILKRKKEDILSELLTGKSSEGIISKKELNALHKLIGDTRQLNSTPDKQSEKTKKNTERKKKKAAKKKATHYVSDEIFKNLDSAKKEIRAILPEKLQSRVSKSLIINQALALILKEFETKGENSRLVQNIIQKK